MMTRCLRCGRRWNLSRCVAGSVLGFDCRDEQLLQPGPGRGLPRILVTACGGQRWSFPIRAPPLCLLQHTGRTPLSLAHHPPEAHPAFWQHVLHHMTAPLPPRTTAPPPHNVTQQTTWMPSHRCSTQRCRPRSSPRGRRASSSCSGSRRSLCETAVARHKAWHSCRVTEAWQLSLLATAAVAAAAVATGPAAVVPTVTALLRRLPGWQPHTIGMVQWTRTAERCGRRLATPSACWAERRATCRRATRGALR